MSGLGDLFGGLFGGGNNQSQPPQQGPFSFGPSMFDLAQLSGAGQTNADAIGNRYNQLGLGGSTMEQQDLSGNDLAINAAIGEEQTSSVTNPAINTALQSPIGTGNPSSGQSLNQLASGLGGALGTLGRLGNTGGTGSTQ